MHIQECHAMPHSISAHEGFLHLHKVILANQQLIKEARNVVGFVTPKNSHHCKSSSNHLITHSCSRNCLRIAQPFGFNMTRRDSSRTPRSHISLELTALAERFRSTGLREESADLAGPCQTGQVMYQTHWPNYSIRRGH